MEAESGDVGLAAYRLAGVGGAKRVRCIREEQRPPELSLHVILGLKLGTNGCGVEQGVDGIVVDGPAPQVHRHDHFGSGAHLRANGIGRNDPLLGIDVDHHRRRTAVQYDVGSRGIGHGRNDDFVTGPNAKPAQR